jgi:hypothetical protein
METTQKGIKMKTGQPQKTEYRIFQEYRNFSDYTARGDRPPAQSEAFCVRKVIYAKDGSIDEVSSSLDVAPLFDSPHPDEIIRFLETVLKDVKSKKHEILNDPHGPDLPRD